jgi:hypothetical protein
MSEETAVDKDSTYEGTLMDQELSDYDGEQQPPESDAADAPEGSPSEHDDEAVVEKRLRDTQAKVTELAEQLKAAQGQLQVLQQPREEPFDEEKFIDEFIGGEEAYDKYRDDPGLLAKDLARKMLHHQAHVLVERDQYWENRLSELQNGIRTKSPDYEQYADTIKEFEDQFDLSGMTPEDKIKLAKMAKGNQKPVKAPPPGPSARKGGGAAPKSSAPPGYFEMLGLVGERKANNTLL